MRRSHRPRSESHRPMRAAGLRNGRRYGIAPAMVEAATERRLAGDWRGACAAAGVDAEIDTAALRAEHGTEFTDRLLDDLHHLAPDLARLHLPRFWNGSGTLVPAQPVLLSRPGGPQGPWLTLRTRGWKVHGDQRLVLKVDDPPVRDFLRRSNRVPYAGHWTGAAHLWTTSRHLWDSRRVGEMRERWGGGADRAPFLDPDGTPRTPDRLPSGDPGPGDPAARTEWIDTLHQTGRVVEALAAAGIGLDPAPIDLDWGAAADPVAIAAGLPLSPARLVGEARLLSGAGFGGRFRIPYSIHEMVVLDVEKDVPDLDVEEYRPWESEELPVLPEVCWARPPDIDVLRDGMTPDELHPLVRAALAPARRPAGGPVTGTAVSPHPAPARVRCRGAWHTVTVDGRGMAVPHGEDEKVREASLRVLGGEPGGCFAALRAWETGHGRLPRPLRAHRDELFERVRHGDTGAVLRYLDAGGDPRIRDRHGRTLLHHAGVLDHAALLPRLLGAGADVNAPDAAGHTPLYFAVVGSGTVELARALLEAGARTTGIGGDHGDELSDAVDQRSIEDSEEDGVIEQDWASLLEEA
ncbi:hypothetical protein SAMN05421803_1304 [Nocardiopsis flavescens]|uniref:Uncharacterized protein n=1 Tax=Nocardiopsis flavescens TaxID=758803 RepID=A0A1M6UUI6_9ACTN|nr:ankyrin repeat domain-containing protein [Nocardiopsis flavescens]SHK72834.1 hypothetical protein SAMN05421803_1304 [Nocardiopsis flavescens]